jgi:hypothetical protein
MDYDSFDGASQEHHLDDDDEASLTSTQKYDATLSGDYRPENANAKANAVVGNHFRQKAQSKSTLRIYAKLLEKSSLPNSKGHVSIINDLYGSDHFPMGQVSGNIYDSIFEARRYDRYGGLVSSKLSAKEQMLKDLQATFAEQQGQNKTGFSRLQHPKKKIDGAAPSTKSDHDPSDNKELRTPQWKIGYKPPVYGPPGLAPPLPYTLNSAGNEKFFSYDGDWMDGHMNGGGIYKFADGMTYEGSWIKDKPGGRGVGKYSSGTIYVGEWDAGYYHGHGVCTYSSGVTYDGEWDKGRRHGHGKLTYKSGTYYEGDFLNNRFDGRGTYCSCDTGIKYVGRMKNGFVFGAGTVHWPDGKEKVQEWPNISAFSFRKAMVFVEDEMVREANFKRDQYQRMYGVIRESELQSYVKDVRADIKADRMATKSAASEEKRRLQREAREKERDRRLQSLIGADGNAIEGAEEEVRALEIEKEEEDLKKERAARAEGESRSVSPDNL